MTAVSVTGLAKEDLSDVQTSVFRGKAEAAGILDGMRLADRPCILDYDDADPTGANSSHAALAEMAADCAGEGLTALITPGNWVLDGDSSITLRNGAGFSGVPWGANSAGFDSGSRRGVAFIIPYSGNRMIPPIAVQRGALLERVRFHYPDVVPRLLDGEYEIDATDYPTIVGGPEAYAPAIVTQHRKNDDGTASASGENVGGVVLRDIGMIGAYDGIYLGDADPEVEAWAAPYSSLTGKGVAGVQVEGFFGYVLRRNLVVERSNNWVECRSWRFTPALWTEAGQMGVVLSSTWPADNKYPLVRWAQLNNTLLTLRRKVLATVDDVAARCGRHVIRCEAGAGMPNPATGEFDPLGTRNGHFAGPDGQDIGKFRFQGRNMAFERYPTLLRMEPTAYIHRSSLEASGHFMDFDDPDCTAPVIDIATDKAQAGAIQKRDAGPIADGEGNLPDDPDWTPTYISPAGTWKPMEDYNGFFNSFVLSVQEASGAILRTNADDGHKHYAVSTPLAHRWGQGDKHGISAFEMLSATNRLYHRDSVVTEADQASGRVYDVVDTARLFPTNNKYFVEDAHSIVVGHADFNGFVGCFITEDVEGAEDDEEGAGGEMLQDPEVG